MTQHSTVHFGDLVVAVFDEAARYGADPRETSRLATRAIKHILWRARRDSRKRESLALQRIEAAHDGPTQAGDAGTTSAHTGQLARNPKQGVEHG